LELHTKTCKLIKKRNGVDLIAKAFITKKPCVKKKQGFFLYNHDVFG